MKPVLFDHDKVYMPGEPGYEEKLRECELLPPSSDGGPTLGERPRPPLPEPDYETRGAPLPQPVIPDPTVSILRRLPEPKLPHEKQPRGLWPDISKPDSRGGGKGPQRRESFLRRVWGFWMGDSPSRRKPW